MKAKIIINGGKYTADAGKTILDVCGENGIRIPTLCHNELLEPSGSCWMCAVDVKGWGLMTSCDNPVADGMEIVTDSEKVIAVRRQVLEEMLANHYGDCESPCREACPAGVDIQGYLALIAKGRNREATELIRETNPLPSIIGRICTRPCETACRRNLVDESLAICYLKRYCADEDLLKGKRPLPQMEPKNGKKVAIIGSGPAGLSAAFYLARKGYEATIFEALPKPGGMLRYGIPEYRLSKKLLDMEIKTITKMGVKLLCNKALGRNFTFSSLKKQGFKSILLAVGAHKSWSLGVKGENLKGVHLGTDFLRDVGLGKKPYIGKNVSIVGGGNTAMDAARTALRLGADRVTVVYRRSRAEMPANVWEIEEAEEENVRFHFLAAPVGVKGKSGNVSEMACIRMKLGEPDASGRRRPVPIEGSEFTIPVDSIVAAIGQFPDVGFLDTKGMKLPKKATLEIGRGSRIQADPATMATNVPGVFTAGDSRRGAATAIEAVADGKVAAESIDQYLTTGKIEPKKEMFTFRKGSLDELDTAQFDHVERKPKVKMPRLRPMERSAGFKEIEQGLTPHMAKEEAVRCLECGCRAADYCELRTLADEYGVEHPETGGDMVFQPEDRSRPEIERDTAKCIACGMCAQMCSEVAVVNALGKSYLSGLPPHWADETLCVSCGQCMDVCPVGAIVHNNSVNPDREVTTICPYCGVGCSITLEMKGDLIIKGKGDPAGPANRGVLCVKGRFGHGFVNHPDRLTTPLIRKRGKLEPATWDEALTLVAKKFKQHKGRFGLLASAKCTNEENYLMQKFARAVMGSNNVDHCARLCHASTVAGLANTLGSGAMTNSIAEIENAACIFAIGTNTTEAHPVIGMGVKRAAKNGAKLIVANPKRIDLCRFATLWLQHRPGTDVALAMGMIKYILDNKLENEKFIKERTQNDEKSITYGDAHTVGFEEFRKCVDNFDLKTVEKITGVPKEKIAAAARIYSTSQTSSILYSMGITQHSHGTENVFALSNLALVTGQIGRPSTGINPLRGQNNVQGACDMGALPNVYPGYQKVNVPEVQKKFEKAWGVRKLDNQIGMTVTEIMGSRGEKEIKALYVIGENPAMSEPDIGHARKVLEKIDFLVVQDIFLTETAQYADVVLPGASFAEKEGTFTNTERRVQLLGKALEPVGKSIPDWKAICMLAKKMGAKGFNFRSPEGILREIAKLTPSYGGITYKRIAVEGLHWPCPTPKHPGTPYLHSEKFPRSNGKATFIALRYRPSEELPDKKYPLMLTTGRSLYHFHTATMSRKNAGLNALHKEELAEINPADAKKLGISNGDMVNVASRRGKVTCRANVSDKVQPGLVFMTFHFAEACANVLTNPALDPIAKIPEYKVCAVKVEKA
ncbi:MAG: formate dehydrogenase subunit alpha [bacterium]